MNRGGGLLVEETEDMTLDELLALLPDNTSGEISAADLRTIVTDLFTKIETLEARVATLEGA